MSYLMPRSNESTILISSGGCLRHVLMVERIRLRVVKGRWVGNREETEMGRRIAEKGRSVITLSTFVVTTRSL